MTGSAQRRRPPRVRGITLVRSWLTKGHDDAKVCPGCGLDVTTVGLPALAYTFRSCECGQWPYAHLVEQLWHRDCLVDSDD